MADAAAGPSNASPPAHDPVMAGAECAALSSAGSGQERGANSANQMSGARQKQGDIRHFFMRTARHQSLE